MQCADYQRWLSPYLDGLLEAAQRSDLEVHLKGCSRCTGALGSLKKLLVSLRQLGDIEAPKDLRQGVQTRLLTEPAWKAWVALVPRALSAHRLAVALTAVLVVVVATPLFLRQPAYKAFQLAKADGKKDAVLTSRLSEARNVPAEEDLRDLDPARQRLSRAVGGSAAVDGSGLASDEYEYASQPETERSGLIVQGNLESADKTVDDKNSVLLDDLSNAQSISALEGRRQEHVQQREPKIVSGLGLDGRQTASETGVAGNEFAKQSEAERSDLLAGVAVGDKVAMVSPAIHPLTATGIQVEWAVSDRPKALEQLEAWLATAEGTLQPAGEDHVILHIPHAQYAGLMDELSKHGRLQFPVKEELEKNKTSESRTKQPAAPYAAPSASSSEQLMTIELYLVQQQ